MTASYERDHLPVPHHSSFTGTSVTDNDIIYSLLQNIGGRNRTACGCTPHSSEELRQTSIRPLSKHLLESTGTRLRSLGPSSDCRSIESLYSYPRLAICTVQSPCTGAGFAFLNPCRTGQITNPTRQTVVGRSHSRANPSGTANRVVRQGLCFSLRSAEIRTDLRFSHPPVLSAQAAMTFGGVLMRPDAFEPSRCVSTFMPTSDLQVSGAESFRFRDRTSCGSMLSRHSLCRMCSRIPT